VTTEALPSTTRPATSTARRWAQWCALGQIVFQIAIAILLYANRTVTADAVRHSGFMPNANAAQGAVFGALLVHFVLAALSALLAWRIPRGHLPMRILGSLLSLGIAIGGITAMSLPSQTYLSPIGVALAIATLVLIWFP
jgi:hypothetical protein